MLKIVTKSVQSFNLRPLSTTPCYAMSAPARKQRVVDPAALRAKEDKRKRRMEKALRKMERKERAARPLFELEVPKSILQEPERRQRSIHLTEEIEDERYYAFKDWSRYCKQRYRNEIRQIDKSILAQKAALEQIRLLDQDLYRQAIALDTSLMPYAAKGPLYTPPIEDYIQDGEYEDVTQKFEIQYADMKSFMRDILKKSRTKKKSKAVEEEE